MIWLHFDEEDNANIIFPLLPDNKAVCNRIKTIYLAVDFRRANPDAAGI